MDFPSALEAMPLVQQNVDLTSLNTLSIPAKATYFCEVDSEAALTGVLAWWKEQQKHRAEPLPIMPLGGGSNLVLAEDFNGLVIRIAIKGRDLIEEDDNWLWLQVGAGENWHDWVEHCMGFHYWGLENLALIPGTVGAAPIQNIGAYGVELCDYFSELRAVDIGSGLPVTFDRDACHFGYRDSVFKGRLKDRYIITSVTFKLRQQPSTVWNYPALTSYFEAHKIAEPDPHQLFNAVCEIRASKLPSPEDIPNAGSFFKNPVVAASRYQSLKSEYEDLVGYPIAGQDADDEPAQYKIAAGWLIDQAGWKGQRRGPVGVHDKQALVLVNPEQGSGAELLALASAIQADIKQRYHIDLEIEPRVYGSIAADNQAIDFPAGE